MKRKYKILVKDKSSDASKEIVIIFDIKEKSKISNWIYKLINWFAIIAYVIILGIGILANLKWLSLMAGVFSLILPLCTKVYYFEHRPVQEQILWALLFSLVFMILTYLSEPHVTLSDSLKYLRTDYLGRWVTFLGLIFALKSSTFSPKSPE